MSSIAPRKDEVGPPCSEASLDAGEPLAGTATGPLSVLVALEHDARWAPKALKGLDLDDPVRGPLIALERDLAGSRVQLISRRERRGDDKLLLVALFEGGPAMLAFDLPSYEALHEIDLAEVVRTRTHPAARLWQGPLYLVCTHGRRDRCCAKLGTPVFDRLAAIEPGNVFRTTHVGGHRFAANVISLPEGLLYGRIGEDEVGELAGCHRGGMTHRIDRLRGRMSLSGPAQAAEIFLRDRLSERGLDALLFDSLEALSESRYLARFTRRHDVAVHGGAGPHRDAGLHGDAGAHRDAGPHRDAGLHDSAGADESALPSAARAPQPPHKTESLSIVVERRPLLDERGRPRLRPSSCGDEPSPADYFSVVENS